MTERGYHIAMTEIEQFLAKGFDNLSPDEDRELERLSKVVFEYESIHFPLPCFLP